MGIASVATPGGFLGGVTGLMVTFPARSKRMRGTKSSIVAQPACSSFSGPRDSRSPRPNSARPSTSACPAPAGVVVSATDVASDIGADILTQGGNAVDAAVATAFALAVTHPFAGNIGGGGFMVVRTPDGKATTFDYREKRAAQVDADDVSEREGRHRSISLTAAGYLAPGVPGTVRGMALAHQRFGKLPWRDVVQPAVEIASQRIPDVGVARARPERRSPRHDEPLPRVR